MKLGSLFSGGGLGDFGFMAAGMEISWQCEIDPYCQKILALRYPESKKYTDIKTLRGADLERIDILTGGFPCQPFSTASHGVKRAIDMWPEMVRIIREHSPKYVVAENVNQQPIRIAEEELKNIGYTTKVFSFSAYEVGADHERNRWWIIAHPYDKSKLQSVINAEMAKLPKFQDDLWSFKNFNRSCRVSNGITDRVHRLKMLGNGQVPACTYVIGKMIMEIEELEKSK